MKEYQTFTTQRLLLVPTNTQDASFILELLNTPKWLQYIGDRNVHTVGNAKNYIIKKLLPQFKKLGFGNYTVIRKSDRTKVGTCGLYDRVGLEGVDIGFGFLPEHEKNGYALESALKLKEVAMNKFNIKIISAITTDDNIASQQLITKLGFTFIKLTTVPDDEKELMLYQITN